MSKRFKGKTCVYCTTIGSSTTADHVIARSFFPTRLRGGIPKVPACLECNSAKSDVETYLSAALPFGGSHPHSTEILGDLVPKRLEKNRKVWKELSEGRGSRAWLSLDGHVSLRQTINVDADRIEQYYKLIVRGLCWSEWSLLLPPQEVEIQVGFLNAEGEKLIAPIFGKQSRRRCERQIADGLFQYEGVQALDAESTTVWRMSLYGVRFIDANQALDTSVACYASTAPIGKALPIGID